MGTWNWLDWVLLVVVLISLVEAAIKGFVRELISLGAVLAGLAIAAVGYERAASWLEDLTHSRQVALAAGFLALFLGTLLLGALLSALARKLIKKGELQRADFLLGAVFGLLRGVVVDCVLLMILVAFDLKPQTVQDSVLAPYVATAARPIALVMPKELREQFLAGFEKLRLTILREDKKAKKN